MLSSVLAENVVGQKVIQSYAAGEQELARVEKENRAFLELRTQALRLLSLYRPLLPALFGIVLGALVYIGGFSFILCSRPVDSGENPGPTVTVRMGEG